MARDCPDRQKGASWRNDGPRAAGRIGGGDGVDREYEVSSFLIVYPKAATTVTNYSCLAIDARTW